jgi:hypothetical protein
MLKSVYERSDIPQWIHKPTVLDLGGVCINLVPYIIPFVLGLEALKPSITP